MTTEQQARQHVHAARDHLTRALGALHKLLPPPNLARLTSKGDPGCASCHRIPAPGGDDSSHWFTTSRSGKGGLCVWCQRATNERRKVWVALHPGQQPPADRRFWPTRGRILWRRDEGERWPPAAKEDEWEAAERKERKGRTKSSRKKAS